MIKILHFGGQLCPVIECDRCSELITHVGLGAVVTGQRLGESGGPIEFRHKGQCFPMTERRPWTELSVFLDQLRRNVESDPRADPELIAVERRFAAQRAEDAAAAEETD